MNGTRKMMDSRFTSSAKPVKSPENFIKAQPADTPRDTSCYMDYAKAGKKVKITK